ncbi:MAG: NAD(P)-binding domain-containing protein [Gemmatimonadetes bacterium]|nr:NAD(P)-binding domain-containing protein [Gemmatimonadota bacterium]
MSDTTIIWLLGAVLMVVTTVPVVLRLRAKEEQSEAADLEALRYGLKEPATLHPVINPDVCIGIGNCVSVCPEGDVLGIRNGQGFPVMPARCIGHGLCERVCPVEAIQLVFGTEKRGVDLPRIQENFETNVPGIYIVGELGGMGLIRNAFEQGRQCIEGIRSESRATDPELLDLVIVGCGPAGLSASLNAKAAGLRFETIEREDLGGTVRHYPRKKLVMTAPVKVPNYGKIGAREMRKEELIETWERVVAEAGLVVRTHETVQSVEVREGGGFDVYTTKGLLSANRVVLAIGRRGVPRKLGVPGEDAPKVMYALREPEAYAGDRILVVGGGDSAVEAAMTLSEQEGTAVHLSYRREQFSRIKPDNHRKLEKAVAAGRVQTILGTQVKEIHDERVILQGADGSPILLPNDQVFVFAGGELPTPFLTACGIEIEKRFGAPRLPKRSARRSA